MHASHGLRSRAQRLRRAFVGSIGRFLAGAQTVQTTIGGRAFLVLVEWHPIPPGAPTSFTSASKVAKTTGSGAGAGGGLLDGRVTSVAVFARGKAAGADALASAVAAAARVYMAAACRPGRVRGKAKYTSTSTSVAGV